MNLAAAKPLADTVSRPAMPPALPAAVARVMGAVAQAAHDRVVRNPARAALVALSGIDGSGKSSLAGPLAQAIERRGLRVAVIGIDPWQNPQSVRFGGANRGEHFYAHAIRFEALFDHLVRPLVARRSIDLRTQGLRTDRDVHEPIEYRDEDIDVVVLEGIFVLQPRFDAMYDVRVWVECSFAAALRRALARNVEGLPERQLRDDYAYIYHAAQRHHLAIDEPRRRVDFVIPNETGWPCTAAASER